MTFLYGESNLNKFFVLSSQGQSRIQAFLEINQFVFSYLKVILEAFFSEKQHEIFGNCMQAYHLGIADRMAETEMY